MSIADHFQHAPDSKFIRDYDSGTARRQLNLSVILIVVIAFAAAALGIVVRFDAPAGPTPAAETNVLSSHPVPPPAYAGRL